MIRAIAIAAALLWVAPAASQFGAQPAPFDARPSTKMVSVSSERDRAELHQVAWKPIRNDADTFWTFAPEAPHQMAAVHVKADGTPYAGSGTLVGTTGDITLIVTNHHVVEINGVNVTQTITCTLRTGEQITGRLLGATPREDVAVYAVDRTDLPCVAISSEEPPTGSTVEVMGFGGPRRKPTDFRPFTAPTITPTIGALAVDAPTISGDSGSGVIWEGVLVGVNFGGPGVAASAGVSGSDPVGLVYPAHSKVDAKFLNAFLTQQCGPQGCQPLIGRPGWLIPRGDQKWDRQPRDRPYPGPDQFYRPENQPPPQQQPPSGGGYTEPNVPDQQPAPPQQPSQPPSLDPPANSPACDCDDERLIAILEEIKQPGPKGERGEQGPQGERGPAGPPGEVGEDQIKDAVAAIYGQIKSDPAFKGPKGDRGEDGEDCELDLDALADMVAQKLPGQRVLLVDGQSGDVINDITYAPGEPIVLDIRKLTNPAAKKR